jgi:hypothetical protein
MKETIRDDGFEATFVVSTPRAEAWARLAAATPAFDGVGSTRPGQWWIPGIEAPADELEVVPEERLVTRKAVQPCKGTEIVLTLTDEDHGTRITIVQTGFGEGFAEQRAWLTAGWRPILADLVIFFERGVSLGRHASMWSSIGCDVVETDEGLVVRGAVREGGFAARAGLQAGDLITRLLGAPIVTIADLSVLTRGPLRPGTEAKVHFVRGHEVRRGVGQV